MGFLYILNKRLVLSKLFVIATFFFFIFSIQVFSQSTGKITGHIEDASTGEALIRVNIIIKGTNIGAASDLKGNYSISNIPSGTYSVSFSLIGFETLTKTNVVVSSNKTVNMDVQLSTSAVELGNVTVYAASRRREKITEAPAAVTVIGAEEIRLKSNSGSIPKLLADKPGIDLVQSGVSDFNLNTRGFNSSVTRRVLVLLDGRDLGAAFLGQQEWGNISYPLEDLGSIEFVRGPGSALYGTNAFNGVLNLTTLTPKQALGTKVKISGGELSTFRFDVRNAGYLGKGFSYKVNFGRLQSKNWDRNRTAPPYPYPGLVVPGSATKKPELRNINPESLQNTYGSARLDYEFKNGDLLTGEAGIIVIQNDVLVTGIGRLNLVKGVRPWGRLHYASEHLDVSIWGQSRTSPDGIFSLSSGGRLNEESRSYQFEAQYNYSFFEDKLRVIAGGSQKVNFVDMHNTAMIGTKDYTITGGYTQFEYKPIPQLKIVATGRVDRTTYEKSRFSPRAAAVWSFLPNHSLRFSYNKAFLLPSLSEYFLRVLAGRVDLSKLGINPGKLTNTIAIGNTELIPERIEGIEVGYKGIFLKNKLFVTVDGYANKINDFITDLLQGVNPAFPFGGAPAGLSDLIKNGSPANGIPALPGLTVLPSGETAIVLSYANQGQVHERGVEVGFNYYLNDEFLVSANWSYFDFNINSKQKGDNLLPNNPKHKFGYSIRYNNPKYKIDAELSGRSVQAFDWAAGTFVGRIPEYHIFNFSAGYKVNQNYKLGLTVTNIFDRQSFQIFGGSIVGRQLIGSFTVSF